jgi:hypothetical protein
MILFCCDIHRVALPPTNTHSSRVSRPSYNVQSEYGMTFTVEISMCDKNKTIIISWFPVPWKLQVR